MHHKRKRPKHQRMACSCKYGKDERVNKRAPQNRKASDYRRDVDARQQSNAA